MAPIPLALSYQNSSMSSRNGPSLIGSFQAQGIPSFLTVQITSFNIWRYLNANAITRLA
jgi:hypothetical protein